MTTRSKFVPHYYQQTALDFIETHDKALLILDMGLGKTVTTLTALKAGLKSGKYKRPLIIAPKIVSENTWASEIAKWQHLKYLKYIEVDATNTTKRLAQYDRIEDGTITILSESKVQWLVDMYASEMLEDNPREWCFDCIVIDEISLFKNPRSNRFQNLHKKVKNKCKYVIGLTGTPAPNSLADLWAIMYLIDGGQRLGKTKKEFNRAFCDEKKIKINSGDNQQYIKAYDVREDMYNEILEAISDVAIAMLAVDYLKDFKRPMYNMVDVELDKKATKQLDEFTSKKALELFERSQVMDDKKLRRIERLESRIAKLKNKYTIEAQVKANKLEEKLARLKPQDGVVRITSEHVFSFINAQRQLVGGAIYEQQDLEGLDEEEIAERVKERAVIDIHDNKLKALDEIIEQSHDNVLVFVSYRHEAARIRARYTGKRVEFLNTANAQKILPLWNAGKIDVLVANPASTKFGLNMQDGGHTIVWYSMGYSFEAFVQSNARLARQGQTSEVTVNVLRANKAGGDATIEHDITDAIEEKRQINDGVYDYLGEGKATHDIGLDARTVAKNRAKEQLADILGQEIDIID